MFIEHAMNEGPRSAGARALGDIVCYRHCDIRWISEEGIRKIVHSQKVNLFFESCLDLWEGVPTPDTPDVHFVFDRHR